MVIRYVVPTYVDAAKLIRKQPMDVNIYYTHKASLQCYLAPQFSVWNYTSYLLGP